MKLDRERDTLAEVQKLWADEKIEDTLELLGKMEVDRLPHPRVLVLKYLCLATSKVTDSELEDLENILKQALELDENYLPALIELAYFRMNVLDKPNEAISLFERATEIAKYNITEITLGHAQCIAELESSKSAIDFISEQKKELINLEKLQKFVEEVDTFSST